MPTFISPSGNPEIWDQKPDGYFHPEEYVWPQKDCYGLPETSIEFYLTAQQASKRSDLVKMEGPRPSTDAVATVTGLWVIPDPLRKQLDAVEAKYAVKEQAIKERVLLVKLADGTLEAQRTAEIQAEWAGVQEEKNQEIEQVLLGGM